MNTAQYFKEFEKEVKKIYDVAEEAKKKGLDPSKGVEIPLAKSMAEKVVELIANVHPQLSGSGITKRILELEKKWGKLNVAVAFKIAEEIAKQKYCKFDSLPSAIDAGIRVGFGYLTLGVVSSPIEGYTKLELGKRRDNSKEYFRVYFSGPVRSAGTTATVMTLMLMDYLREMFGYAKYDPTEEEVKRYIIENHDYHERITNLQYMPTDEEIEFLAKNLPIQIAGEPTEKKEVSNFKNLDRVDTNNIRGGMCLAFSEGLAQKAKKGLRLLRSLKDKGFKTSGWDYLEDYVKLHEERDKGKTDSSPTYMNDLVAGRPVFSHPSRSGGFRFRYGRGRVSGFSASSVHPATMAITDGFLAFGTQLKIEKPTKGTAVTSCDGIDGPIVKLFNGSVKKLESKEEAKRLYPDVEEIIYLGDLLFPLSDLTNRNSVLITPGYFEEWWSLDLEEKNSKKYKNLDYYTVDFDDAVKISREEGIPLHPTYIFYWTQISKDQFSSLIDWIKNANLTEGKIIFPYYKEVQEKYASAKRALELLGVEHKVTLENVVVGKKNASALFANLGLDLEFLKAEGPLKKLVDSKDFSENKEVLESINENSEFIIKDKAGEFIGARMGRPEKAKLRKLTGSPNVLFPVGNQGGRLRSVQEACRVGKVSTSLPIYYCEECGRETVYNRCEICGRETKQKYYCPICDKVSYSKCKLHDRNSTQRYKEIDINEYLGQAKKKLGLLDSEMPEMIKGVRGLMSSSMQVENLAKGILRAKYNLQVNKDGTVRLDATELPLISFRPKEISAGVETLKKFGYTEDIYGKKLENENQILELKPHDIVLPSNPESQEERADEVFTKVSSFVDDLLEKFYGLPRFYNLKERNDLIGHLGVCMAPHNCAGVVCRFIGFSNTFGLLASPYMHAAIRRDCDGDEAAIMLLGDVLLNFSKSFLPDHRGGSQDAPLVLNAKIDAGEVDDQILDFEFVDGKYPAELYRLAEKKVHSSELKSVLTVDKKMRKGEDPFVGFGFTHDVSNFNNSINVSTYKTIPTMQEKVQHQMKLAEKLRAVDTPDIARLIIEKHFIRDIRGNLREFSMQNFRCVGCNYIMRRPPLSGKCPKCGGKIIFTIHEGGIKKYLEPALNLARKNDLSPYLVQHLEITKRQIDSIFGRELEKQEKLKQWF